MRFHGLCSLSNQSTCSTTRNQKVRVAHASVHYCLIFSHACVRQAQPVHLWDACTGRERATYRTYDLMDEIEAAYSVAFSLDGSQLLAGYQNRLCVFDTSRPGRESVALVTRKRKEDGLPGLLWKHDSLSMHSHAP